MSESENSSSGEDSDNEPTQQRSQRSALDDSEGMISNIFKP